MSLGSLRSHSTSCTRLHSLTRASPPSFGDVVVVRQALKKPPSLENRGTTRVCLGHDRRVSGGVLVVSVVDGLLQEVCSAKFRRLGAKVGQPWRLCAHPQDVAKAAYVRGTGEVKWK